MDHPQVSPPPPPARAEKATLDKTELEAYVAIVTGAQPIDYFDTFVSEWKRLGGDAISRKSRNTLQYSNKGENRMKIRSKIHSNQAYQLYYHGMMLPGFIFLILFNFVPMFGAIMAFQDHKPAKGFSVLTLWASNISNTCSKCQTALRLFRNTLIIALGKIVFYHHHVHRLCDSAQ